VPVTNVVAGENLGWKLITNQLNHERVALGPAGRLNRHLTTVLRWSKETTLADGTRPIDLEWVRVSLARVHAVVEALKLANWRVAGDQHRKSLNPADASAMKVLGTEQQWRCLDLLLEIVGQLGYLADGSPDAVLYLALEQAYRAAPVGTFGGGVNEVQREIIAMAGLGMPRAPR
jgi:alkylation response protein AidB-like acyl-CoA dehydrogenase